MTIDSLEYESVDDELDALEDASGIVRCPECKSQYVRIEGKCITCETCGYSRCELD
jgi:transposase-like protein